MANPDDERDGEDLFDDLDKFFAPIEETDWPEPEADAPAPRVRGRSATPDVSAEDLFPEGWDELEGKPEADEELLEAAASPAPEDTSSFEFSIDEPAAETPSVPTRRRSRRGAPEPEPEPVDLGDTDWSQTGVGGEGEEEESFLFGAAAAEPEVPAAPAPPPEPEPEPAELTIDHLKVAPPEYAELPGPGADEPSPDSIFGEPDEPAFATAEPSTPSGRGDEPTTPDAGLAAAFEELELATPVPRAAGDPFAEEARSTTSPAIEDELLAGLDQTPSTPRTVKVGTDEPIMGHGPAWEDPTSHAVVGESAPARGGRNLSAALISGVALGALALILLAIGPAPFAVLAAAVLIAAQAELYAVAHGRGYQPATALGLVMGGLVLYASYNKGEIAMGAMVTLGLMLTFFWYMVAPAKARKGTLVNAAVTLLGLVYVPFFAGVIFQLLPRPGGRALVIWIIGLTVIYDVFAFIIGSFWGRRPLAGSISPNKSWEGAFGASLVTFVVGLAFGPQIAPLDVGSSIGLALVVLIMAPLGDLAESVLKRDLGVKDMSTIMPGHGGLMDRIDSLLFVLPAAFYFLRIVL